MSECPSGWVWTDTATVAEVQGGIQKQPKRRPTVNHYPFLRVANVMRGRLDLHEIHEIELFEGELEKFRLHVGDLLVVEGNGSPDQIGRAARWHGDIEDCVHQNHLIRVRPTAAIDSKYLTHYWNASRTTEYLRSVASSTSGLYVLTAAKVRSVRIPLPPLEEQRRIVAAIDEQFSRLDTGVAALKRVRHNLKRMRADSFLHLHDKALLASRPRPMNDLCEFIVDGDHNPPKRTDTGVPYLTAKHVKRGHISVEGASFISQEDFTSVRRRYDPRKGDVLVTCVGTLGEIAVVPDGLTFAADRNLAALRPRAEVMSSFLEAMLRSPRLQKVLTAGSGSTAQPHLYLRDLRQLQVPVPALETQESLVVTLREQLAFADQLEKDVEAALARSERLRASILVAAFSGRLVPQHGDDELASSLLKRIAAERASSDGRRTARTRPRQPLRREVTT